MTFSIRRHSDTVDVQNLAPLTFLHPTANILTFVRTPNFERPFSPHKSPVQTSKIVKANFMQSPTFFVWTFSVRKYSCSLFLSNI